MLALFLPFLDIHITQATLLVVLIVLAIIVCAVWLFKALR